MDSKYTEYFKEDEVNVIYNGIERYEVVKVQEAKKLYNKENLKAFQFKYTGIHPTELSRKLHTRMALITDISVSFGKWSN